MIGLNQPPQATAQKCLVFVKQNFGKLKRCCNQTQLQHKANETFLKALCAAHKSTNKCIFKELIQNQKTGIPAKCRTRFMQWPVV